MIHRELIDLGCLLVAALEVVPLPRPPPPPPQTVPEPSEATLFCKCWPPYPNPNSFQTQPTPPRSVDADEEGNRQANLVVLLSLFP